MVGWMGGWMDVHIAGWADRWTIQKPNASISKQNKIRLDDPPKVFCII